MNAPTPDLMPLMDAAAVVRAALRAGLARPPRVNVAQWADAHRRLPSKGAAEPGLWRTDRVRLLITGATANLRIALDVLPDKLAPRLAAEADAAACHALLVAAIDGGPGPAAGPRPRGRAAGRTGRVMGAPLAIDLFCGLGGWTDGLLAAGYEVVGFDIERHVYGAHRYPAQLVLQDVTTLHGAQFRDAALIVASPPCQEFSYMAMPWTRAKQIAAALRGQGDFPAGYTGSRTVADLTRLFDACFRIQREACEAAGRHIPLVVENVKGAQPWVGRARWNFGSFYLWGDVPALMPLAKAIKVGGFSWSDYGTPDYKARAFNGEAERATKNAGGSWFNIGSPGQKETNRNPVHAITKEGVKQGGNWFHDSSPGTLRSHSGSTGRKQPGIGGPRRNGKGDAWFQDGAARHGSKSTARKAASALIAKIPTELARHIGAVYATAAQSP